MTTAELDAAPTETPGVWCVGIEYAGIHLSKLLRHVDEGGYVLIRHGNIPSRRQYWLGGTAPDWWAPYDDTPLLEAGLHQRMREMRRAKDQDGQVHD
jgi:hypothetical protein